jgi:phospholipid/cholesterol/gamma-HCH transport system substrate-binding protein
LKISKEIKVAILVLSGILLFIFGFNYLKGENILGSSRTFYAVYDNVEGLTASTPVTINGMPVGKVLEINFKGDGSGKLLVKLLIESKFQFSKNSRAELYETGLIGGKAIAIIPAFDGAENAQNDSYLDGGVKAGLSELVNQRLTPLQEKIEKMMLSADELLVNLNDVFDEKTKNNLKNSIAGLSTTIASFKETSNTLNQTIINNQKNIDSVLSNANSLTSNLSEITGELNEAELGGAIDSLKSTLKNFNKILTSLENSEGSMGKLLNDDAMYENLTAATKEMKELLEDIKLHPKRYFRILSKKEIPYSEPESN